MKLSTILLFSLLVSSALALKIVTPPQINSRTTHYPTWRTPVPGWNAQQLDTVTSSSFIGAFLGIILAVRYQIIAKKALSESTNGAYHNNSYILSTVIAYYIFATLLAILSFWILDLGKLWSTIGALHNLLEVSILLVMTFSGHPNIFKHFYLILFVYLAITEWICLILPWPYDAIFFKIQGLVSDIALIFGFYRLYLANKHTTAENIQGPEEIEADRNEYTSLLTKVKSNTFRKSYLFSEDSNNGQSSSIPIASLTDPNQTSNNIKLLIVASAIHVFGNTAATVSDTFLPFLIFQFSYGIVYFLYGYYISQQGWTSRLQWYKTSIVSELLVAFVSVIISVVIVGIGVYVTLRRFQDYNGGNRL